MESAIIESPLGPISLVADETGLAAVRFISGNHFKPVPGGHEILVRAARQLNEYFSGSRRRFDIPLVLDGTGFQVEVWNELTKIPFGDTISYGELARRINRPDAVRAVGTANGANPIPIIVPCHRVVGSDGSLTGYGGGIEIKRALLVHEGARLF